MGSLYIYLSLSASAYGSETSAELTVLFFTMVTELLIHPAGSVTRVIIPVCISDVSLQFFLDSSFESRTLCGAPSSAVTLGSRSKCVGPRADFVHVI